MTDDKGGGPEMFGAWLSKTKELQEDSFGFDFDAMRLNSLAFQDYLRTNHTAAVLELGEMLEETRWKPWAILASDDQVVPDRRAVAKEAVDALHFVANFLTACGVTDEEFEEAYIEKMEVNRERQRRAGGYRSRRGEDKCTDCGRSFDDVGASDALPGFCIKCEAERMKAAGL